MSASILKAYNPATGAELPGEYHSNSIAELEASVAQAAEAFVVYSKTSGEERAIFLETIADEIESIVDQLVERATAETGLPAGRIQGETGRTVGQLRMFASIARDASWVEASIDTAIPDRQPLPKSDIRKLSTAIGPVGVFGASNFPLAFSTAGGDTASALAAGCPVIVKGHNGHLGTHQLIVEAIERAVETCNMPKGVFCAVIGEGFEIGQSLVQHPEIKAVGFTGSQAGGKALYDLAVSRPEPIPFYAEMSSINPVVLLPSALKKEELDTQLAGSICLGVGQFCTNPGLIVTLKNDESDDFVNRLGEAIKASTGGVMLNAGIHANYEKTTDSMTAKAGINVQGSGQSGEGAHSATPIVATASGADFLADAGMMAEVFGPYSLVVQCADEDELAQVLLEMEGQLTISFMGTDDEINDNEHLVAIATQKAGRVIFNGVPTGVEVCHSMIHGGPFPATSDSRTTSVGADAIKRFARPVCYQDAPQAILPLEIQDENPLGILRKVNGSFSTDKI